MVGGEVLEVLLIMVVAPVAMVVTVVLLLSLVRPQLPWGWFLLEVQVVPLVMAVLITTELMVVVLVMGVL